MGGKPAVERVVDICSEAGFYNQILILTDNTAYTYAGNHGNVYMVREDPRWAPHEKIKAALDKNAVERPMLPKPQAITMMYGVAVLMSPSWLRNARAIIERGYVGVNQHKITRVWSRPEGAYMRLSPEICFPDYEEFKLRQSGVTVDIDYPDELKQAQMLWSAISAGKLDLLGGSETYDGWIERHLDEVNGYLV